MLLKSPLKISRNPRIKVTLFILYDVDKPGRFFHATSIAIMIKIRIPFSEFQLSFSRGSGPGGQNVNKVNTKVHLLWDITASESVPYAVKERFRTRFATAILDDGLVQIVGQKHRTQKANIEDCIDKLHAMIDEVTVPPKKRKATKPTYGSVQKRLTSKKRDSQTKQLRKKDY